MLITPTQIRAARAMLNWTAKDLATRVKMSPATISMIENEQTKGSLETINSIHAAFIQGGVEFLPNDGLCRKQANVMEYNGVEGFRRFMDDVYQTARDVGGDIVLHNAKPAYWHKWLGKEWHKEHTDRMVAIRDNYNLRITAVEGDTLLIASPYAEYRWIPSAMFNDRSFYAYGSKLAFLNFGDDYVQIFVLNQHEFAQGFVGIFDIAWQHAAHKPGDVK